MTTFISIVGTFCSRKAWWKYFLHVGYIVHQWYYFMQFPLYQCILYESQCLTTIHTIILLRMLNFGSNILPDLYDFIKMLNHLSLHTFPLHVNYIFLLFVSLCSLYFVGKEQFLLTKQLIRTHFLSFYLHSTSLCSFTICV